MYRWGARVPGLLAAACAGLHLANVASASIDHDEVEHLHAAWMVAQGHVPFVDFFENHPPVLWYALAPLVDACPPGHLVLAGRLAMLPFLAGILALAYRIGRRLTGNRRAAWLGMLLLPATWVFLRTTLEVRPDVPQVFLEVLALDLFLSWLERPRARTAAAAGLAAGAAIAVLSKAVVLLPALAAGIAVASWSRSSSGAAWKVPGERGRRAAHAGLAALAALLPLAILYGGMAAAGMLADYRACAIDHLAAFQMTAALDTRFSILPGLWSVARTSPGLFLAGVPGLVLLAMRWRDPRHASVLATLAFTAGFLAMSGMPYKQYYLALWVLLAPAAAVLFDRLESRAGQGRGAFVMRGLGPVLVAVSLAMGAASLSGTKEAVRETAVARRILAVTRPGDPVLAQPPWHPIARPDAGYLWFNLRDFLSVLDQMEASGQAPDPGWAARMRRVVDRPPAAVFVSRPADLQDIPGLAQAVEGGLHPDTLVRNLFVR